MLELPMIKFECIYKVRKLKIIICIGSISTITIFKFVEMQSYRLNQKGIIFKFYYDLKEYNIFKSVFGMEKYLVDQNIFFKKISILKMRK